MIWLKFIISAAVIVLAGIRLTKYTDYLSDALNLGKLWIGAVLLGIITSLPEAVTSFIAIVTLDAADLAVGNLLGSNCINPMLIVFMDVMYRQGAFTNIIQINRSHMFGAIFAIVLTLIVGAEIALSAKMPVVHLGKWTPATFLIIGLYFYGMWLLSKKTDAPEEEAVATDHLPSLGTIWMNILVCAAAVVVAAMFLTNAADVIAEQTGLGRTFVGSIFLAFVTSLPELVVSLSALKLGSFDLAIGNIFGSNMSNMFILAVGGFLYKGDLMLSSVAQTHLFTVLLSVTLCFIGIKGIQWNNKRSIVNLGIDSIIMSISFFLGAWILYVLR